MTKDILMDEFSDHLKQLVRSLPPVSLQADEPSNPARPSSPPAQGVQQPSIGRIVHYVLDSPSPFEGKHRPAIITEVWNPITTDGTIHSGNGMCNLVVFKSQDNDGGVPAESSFCVGSRSYSADPKPCTWHWPEYVPSGPPPVPSLPAVPVQSVAAGFMHSDGGIRQGIANDRVC
jgi:hypothetical protein